MEHSPGVEVGHPASDVPGDLDSNRPGELDGRVVKKVLKGTTIDVLGGVVGAGSESHTICTLILS